MNHNRYCLVKNTDADQLARQVEKKMTEGWSCTGGVAVCTIANQTCYTQAMTRYEQWFPRDKSGSSQ